MATPESDGGAREREMLRLADETLQALVAASWAFERDDPDLARRLVAKALTSTRSIMGRTLSSVHEGTILRPGSFRNDLDKRAADG